MTGRARHSDKAPIFAIDRLRMGTDGKGITTLVCFMGCPLRCAYCLNDKCHEEIYEADGRTPREGIMLLTPRQLYNRVKIDDIYFQATGGGICFGGGEPMMYARFIEEFAKLCGKRWKITVETALYSISYAEIEQLAPIVDLWFFDIKSMNTSIYEKYTNARAGGHVAQSLGCLRQLHLTDKTIIKVPLIPEFGDKKDVEESIRQIEEWHHFHNIMVVQYVKRLSKYHKTTAHER